MAATTLLSDNGASSGTSGYKLTGGNDGTLQLQTATSGGTATTAVTIDNSQNVGIGTSSPSNKLQVSGTGSTYIAVTSSNAGTGSGLYTANATNSYYIGAGAYSGGGSLEFRDNTNSATRMVIDTSGNVGIGTSSPTQPLTVGNTSTVRGQVYVQAPAGSSPTMTLDYTAQSGGHKYILYSGGSAAGNFDLYDATAAAYRMTVDSSGNLLVGTTSSSGRLTVTPAANTPGIKCIQTASGDYCYHAVGFNNGGTYYYHYFIAGSTYTGQITSNGTTTSYTSASDYRLKENVQPLSGALSKVAALKPVSYKWKATGQSDEGFIAHELAEVCPQAVTGEKDAVDSDGNPIYQGIDTSFLVATLTAAIQEQQAIITSLTERITALENK